MIQFYVILYAFLLYADVLTFIPLINYWDEAFAILIPIIVIFKAILLRKFTFKKIDFKQLVIIFIILLLGIAGNIYNPGIQEESSAIVREVLLFVKFPLLMVFLRTATYDWSAHKKEIIVKYCNYVSKINISVAGILAVIGYFINIGVYTEGVRYFKCYRFLYRHPTFLVANLVFCISLLILESKQKNKYFIYIGCVLLFMTQRNKAYAVLALILIIMILKESYLNYFFSFKWKTKIKMKYVLPVSIIVCLIMYYVFKDKFTQYLNWGMTSARIALTVTSVLIAKDYFPFGSGLGTFASSLSAKYYSNIYYMYDLYEIDGLREDEYNYVSDNFWPWVLGEFGFISTILYVVMFFRFIRSQFINIKKQGRLLAFIILWFYALLASTMEAYFTNTTGIAFAIIISIYVGVDGRMYKQSNNNMINNKTSSLNSGVVRHRIYILN